MLSYIVQMNKFVWPDIAQSFGMKFISLSEISIGGINKTFHIIRIQWSTLSNILEIQMNCGLISLFFHVNHIWNKRTWPSFVFKHMQYKVYSIRIEISTCFPNAKICKWLVAYEFDQGYIRKFFRTSSYFCNYAEYGNTQWWLRKW